MLVPLNHGDLNHVDHIPTSRQPPGWVVVDNLNVPLMQITVQTFTTETDGVVDRETDHLDASPRWRRLSGGDSKSACVKVRPRILCLVPFGLCCGCVLRPVSYVRECFSRFPDWPW